MPFQVLRLFQLPTHGKEPLPETLEMLSTQPVIEVKGVGGPRGGIGRPGPLLGVHRGEPGLVSFLSSTTGSDSACESASVPDSPCAQTIVSAVITLATTPPLLSSARAELCKVTHPPSQKM